MFHVLGQRKVILQLDTLRIHALNHDMEHETQDRIRRTLRLLLAARDMNAGQLADKLGMNKQQMSNRITGRTHWSIDLLEDIARVLEVRPAVWFDEPQNALSHLADTSTEGNPGGATPEANNRWTSPDNTQTDDFASPFLTTRELACLGVA